MANDARRTENMRKSLTPPAATGAVVATDEASGDPLASAIGYEAADPALLARQWGEVPDLSAGDRR